MVKICAIVQGAMGTRKFAFQMPERMTAN